MRKPQRTKRSKSIFLNPTPNKYSSYYNTQNSSQKSCFHTPITSRRGQRKTHKDRPKTPRINFNLVLKNKKDKFYDEQFKGDLDKVMSEAYQVIQSKKEKIDEID